MVEPESASWSVLTRPVFKLLLDLQTPKSLKELEDQYPDIGIDTLMKCLTKLFHIQCISIDGRLCFDPRELWQKKHEFPYYINIHATSRCNFSCKYCYNTALMRGSDMTLETANYIQKRLFLELPLKHLTFQFHGGEPLLLFHTLIVPFAKSSEQLSKKFCKSSRVLVQSNGSLIDEEMARIIKDMDIGIGISLDGDEESHNLHRVYPDGRGTHRDVKKGFEQVIKLNKHTAPLACIREPWQYSSFVNYFIREEISDFVIRPVYPIGRGKEKGGITPENAKFFAYEFLKSMDILARQNEGKTVDYYRSEDIEKRKTIFRNIAYYLELLISKERTNMCYRSPCGAGNCIIAFDINGDIYPCEEMVAYKKFKIGNIFQRENLANIILESESYQMLNTRLVDNLNGCRICPWRHFCGGGCPSKITASGESLEYGDYYCKFLKIVLEEFAWKISHDPSLVTKTLSLEYLKENPLDSSLWRISL